MQKEMRLNLRLRKIRSLNCLPFYFGLVEMLRKNGTEPEMSFFESYPAEINQAMDRGEIDAAPVSSLEYLQHQDKYLLLPDLAIGTQLFARSVLLLSRKKIEQLNGETIALSAAIGVSPYSGRETWEAVLSRADQDMYLEKSNGTVVRAALLPQRAVAR
mgnify:CR=1 FL=1